MPQGMHQRRIPAGYDPAVSAMPNENQPLEAGIDLPLVPAGPLLQGKIQVESIADGSILFHVF